MLWANLEGEVHDLLRQAIRSVLLVAPFIKEAAFRGLLEAVGPTIELEVYTRWLPEEVASGVSDTSVLEVVAARGGTLGLIDELHAKLVSADLRQCLVGSANVTAAALGTGSRPNLEIMCRLDDVPGSLALFSRELRKRARAATQEERRVVEDEAALLREDLPRAPPPNAAPPNGEPLGPWLPRFRSPDRLYSLYSDPQWIARAGPDDPALMDIVDLGLPGDLPRVAFEARVRRELLASPVCRLIDRLLDRPRRFGEVSRALAGIVPGEGHASLQSKVQTLFRWLLYFAPDLYRLDTPNYSEVLSRR